MSRSVLKDNQLFLVGDADFQVEGGEAGLYRHDTRYLCSYRWELDGQPICWLSKYLSSPAQLRQYGTNHDLGYLMKTGIRRSLRASGIELCDRLELSCHSSGERTLRLHFAADFADIFEVRGHPAEPRAFTSEPSLGGVRLVRKGLDGLLRVAEIRSDPPAALEEGALCWRTSQDLHVTVRTQLLEGEERFTPEDRCELPPPTSPVEIASPRDRQVVQRGLEDLQSLLFDTESGPFPAAGIPWFVAPFGRDALIMAHLALPYRLDLARQVLRFLSLKQGKRSDPFTLEAPGKILHEERYGELTRTGRTPHRPYFGTADATPLYLWLMGRYLEASEDLAMVLELRPHWEAALAWLEREGDSDGDGLLDYRPHSGGLTNQVWKDSADSVFDEFGREPEGPRAIVELQGYGYAAYRAAAQLYRACGQPALAGEADQRASRLQDDFERLLYWPELGYYYHGLAGGRPLRVVTSNPVHALWSGIASPRRAEEVAALALHPRMFSGWGLRTLADDQPRYNPVSYHNGSVWPHDTAIAALGLARYHLTSPAATLARALFDAAGWASDLRLPELFAGYPREEGPPVPFPAACHPQGWDTVVPLALASLLS